MKKSVFVLALLCACGGGGGGGDAAPAGEDGVRILHGVIDAAPFEVKNEDSKTVSSSRFGVPSAYGELIEGKQKVKVVAREKSDATITSFDIEVKEKTRFSILAYGTNLNQTTRFVLLNDKERGEVAEDSASIRFVNALDGAGNIVGEAASNTENVEVGNASAYINVPAGTNEIKIKTQAGTQIYIGNQDFEAGKSYSLLVLGRVGYFTAVSKYNG